MALIFAFKPVAPLTLHSRLLLKHRFGIPVVAFLALATALNALDGDASQGNELFDEQCAQCHNAYSEEVKKGPALKFLFLKDRLESDGRTVTEANVWDKIEKGGNGMPPFRNAFSDKDKADLLAFLKKL